MIRIAITQEIEKKKDGFISAMLYKKTHGTVVAIAQRSLNELKKNIATGVYLPTVHYNYIQYIEKIINEYKTLLGLHPSEFSNKASEFDHIINPANLSVKIALGTEPNSPKKEFYELLVEKMRYSYVQNKVFPAIADEL